MHDQKQISASLFDALSLRCRIGAGGFQMVQVEIVILAQISISFFSALLIWIQVRLFGVFGLSKIIYWMFFETFLYLIIELSLMDLL